MMRAGVTPAGEIREPGIGIDIVEVARIRDLANHYGDRFLRKIFTESELDTCFAKARPSESLAARFAAKEAFAKAWPGPVLPGWHDVEVVMEGSKPTLRLRGLALGWSTRLSMSHTHEFAVAMVWLEAPGRPA